MFDKLKKWLTMEDDTAEPSVLPKEELKAPVPPVKAPRKPKDSKPELNANAGIRTLETFSLSVRRSITASSSNV